MKQFLSILLLSMIFLFCNQKTTSPNLWYVSNKNFGDGSANSWENAQSLATFSWAIVSAGDSVYVDGGIDSLIYDFTPYSFYPDKSGSAGNKIIIARGKDSGHNGRPIFVGSDNKNSASIGVNNIEVNGLVFKDGSIDGGGVISIRGSNVDIFNCEILHPRTIGVIVEANNFRFMYNKIFTGIVSNDYATDGMWIGGGASSNTDVGGGIYGSAEIGYNYFLMQNSSGTGHKDALQITLRWQEAGGITKIHHNFFGAIPQSASTNADLIYVDDGSAGHYLVYNNVFVQKNFTDGGYVNFFGDQQKLGMWVKCYNNTVYNTTPRIYSWKFYDIDSLDFRNNIVYAPNCMGALGVDYYTEILGTFKNIDYNQYQVNNQNQFAYMQETWDNHPNGNSEVINFTQWKSRMGEGPNSKIIKFIFAGGIETLASSYKLAIGSSGIDEGTLLTSFSDDYEGDSRPQNGFWDVGAFEK